MADPPPPAWTLVPQVVLFSDLHGHSRKTNIFAYGCSKVGRPLRGVQRAVLRGRGARGCRPALRGQGGAVGRAMWERKA